MPCNKFAKFWQFGKIVNWQICDIVKELLGVLIHMQSYTGKLAILWIGQTSSGRTLQIGQTSSERALQIGQTSWALALKIKHASGQSATDTIGPNTADKKCWDKKKKFDSCSESSSCIYFIYCLYIIIKSVANSWVY